LEEEDDDYENDESDVHDDDEIVIEDLGSELSEESYDYDSEDEEEIKN